MKAYILIDEFFHISKVDALVEDDLTASDNGCLNILDITNPLKPFVHVGCDEWEEIEQGKQGFGALN